VTTKLQLLVVVVVVVVVVIVVVNTEYHIFAITIVKTSNSAQEIAFLCFNNTDCSTSLKLIAILAAWQHNYEVLIKEKQNCISPHLGQAVEPVPRLLSAYLHSLSTLSRTVLI